jgi:hypothetical protein
VTPPHRGTEGLGSTANPLGVPTSEREWRQVLADLARQVRLPAALSREWDELTGRLLADVARQLQLMEATRRWRFTQSPRREPPSLVPGDVVGLRASTVFDLVLSVLRGAGQPSIRADAAPLSALLNRAQAYWLPPDGTAAVLDSEPPPDLDELRLPFPAVTVWFAQAVSPGAALRPPAFDQLRRVWFEARADDAPDEWYLAAAVDEALTAADRAPEVARLDGALLLADESGRLLDLAPWVVYAPTPGPRVRYRTPLPCGRRAPAGAQCSTRWPPSSPGATGSRPPTPWS